MGPVPDGLFVLHKCDTPQCANVDHLFLGTARDNSRDMHTKKRAGGLLTSERVSGTRNVNAKLTPDIVREIRKAYDARAQWSAIAQRFGISRDTVYRVGTRKSWGHVP